MFVEESSEEKQLWERHDRILWSAFRREVSGASSRMFQHVDGRELPFQTSVNKSCEAVPRIFQMLGSSSRELGSYPVCVSVRGSVFHPVSARPQMCPCDDGKHGTVAGDDSKLPRHPSLPRSEACCAIQECFPHTSHSWNLHGSISKRNSDERSSLVLSNCCTRHQTSTQT